VDRFADGRRRAIREAEAELSRCQRAYDRDADATKQHLDALRDVNAKRLGKCHGVTLFERVIATPQGTVPLVRARAEIPEGGPKTKAAPPLWHP
jgi:hypothetical protein